MFTLTDAAARQVQVAVRDADAQELALRIAAQFDDAGEVQYGMGFDDPKEEDLLLDLQGIPIVIGSESQHLLQHILLDWVELEPGNFRFIFIDSRMQGAAHAGGGACATGCGSGSGGCGSGGGSCGSGGAH
jgi:iron-sulfur cluster assembly protein